MVSRVAPTPKPPKPTRAKNVMTGITLAGQMPAVEHARNGHVGNVWRIWLSYDEAYDTGMYLQLNEDGSIWRYVIKGRTIVKADEIKDKDPGKIIKKSA